MLKAPFKTAILNPSNTLKTELKNQLGWTSNFKRSPYL